MTVFILHSLCPYSVRRGAFSTGFVFEYWNEDEEMSVKPVHQSLKDEVMASGRAEAKLPTEELPAE